MAKSGRGRIAAASLILILVPYAVFSLLVFTAPTSAEDFYTNSSVRGNCSQYASSSRTLQVSQGGTGQFPSISSAVSVANPGDKIVVHRGIYHEEVLVTRPCLTIIGVDRKGVVLDGQKSLNDGITVSEAAGVTVANLTARNYLQNGFYYVESNDWTIMAVDGVNEGHYGIYTVASTYGVMANDFTMGNGDSGFYIGEVPDCRCSIVNSTAYGNVLGYSGTRANGVTISHSRFVNNSVGIGPNTLLPDISVVLSGNWKLPLFATNHTIVNNVIEDNNNATVIGVGISQTYGVPIGTGISMLGTSGSAIANNTISGNKLWGIAEFTFLNLPTGNRYSSNSFFKNGRDFFTDGTGFFGCSEGEQATGSIPPACSLPSWLRITIPNPYNELILAVSVGRPGLSNDFVAVLPFIPLIALSTGLSARSSPRGRRIGSGLVDLLVAGDVYLLLMSLVVVLGFGASNLPDVAFFVTSITLLLSPLAYFILVTSWVFYGLVLEGLRRQTVGQWILRMKVTNRAGQVAGFPRILAKNLLLYVDTLFFGIVGILSILIKRKTIGELISGTNLQREDEW